MASILDLFSVPETRGAPGFRSPTDLPDPVVSSGYGRRERPVPGASTYHRAYDVVSNRSPAMTSRGDAVAAAPGTVVSAGWQGGYGYTVVIDHGNGYQTRYSHLAAPVPGLEVGATVAAGQPLGDIGATGLPGMGTHLDFGVTYNGRPINPETVGFGRNTAMTGRAGYPELQSPISDPTFTVAGQPQNIREFSAAIRPVGAEAPAVATPGRGIIGAMGRDDLGTVVNRSAGGMGFTPAPAPAVSRGGIMGALNNDNFSRVGVTGADQVRPAPNVRGMTVNLPSPDQVPSPVNDPARALTTSLTPGTQFSRGGVNYVGDEFAPAMRDEIELIGMTVDPARVDALAARGEVPARAAARAASEATRQIGFSPTRSDALTSQIMGHSDVPQTMSFSGSLMAGAEPRVQSATPMLDAIEAEVVAAPPQTAALSDAQRGAANAALAQGLAARNEANTARGAQPGERGYVSMTSTDAREAVAAAAPANPSATGPGGMFDAPASPAPAPTPVGLTQDQIAAQYNRDFSPSPQAVPTASAPAPAPTPVQPAQQTISLPQTREEIYGATPATPAPQRATAPAPVQTTPQRQRAMSPAAPSPAPAPRRNMGGFLPGMEKTGIPEMGMSVGVTSPAGSRIGFSPIGTGFTSVYDRAPEHVKVAATGPGIFGAFDQASGTSFGARANRGIANSVINRPGAIGGGILGAGVGSMVAGPVGGILGGLGGAFFGGRAGGNAVRDMAGVPRTASSSTSMDRSSGTERTSSPSRGSRSESMSFNDGRESMNERSGGRGGRR